MPSIYLRLPANFPQTGVICNSQIMLFMIKMISVSVSVLTDETTSESVVMHSQYKTYPAGWRRRNDFVLTSMRRQNDVVLPSMRRNDVASITVRCRFDRAVVVAASTAVRRRVDLAQKLLWRRFDVMCLLFAHRLQYIQGDNYLCSPLHTFLLFWPEQFVVLILVSSNLPDSNGWIA